MKVWLLTGLIMILFQIMIGGVTRLTGSGLSITRWEIVTGSIPPLNAAQWQEAFDLYRATPQYHKINTGMSLGDFKFIYFWEYFHRLWARLMGLVFIFPFFWFLWKGMLSRRLTMRLLVVVSLAALEGFFGWIMVASGLIYRPWVNAYNLTLHLVTALVIYTYLLCTIFIAYHPGRPIWPHNRWRRLGWGILGLLFVQLALGALMSGTKAGLFYPTWPDQGGTFLPQVLLDGANWKAENFVNYDQHPFMPALVQFFHRNTAYLLLGLIIYLAVGTRGLSTSADFRTAVRLMLVALAGQIALGIVTVLQFQGQIPVLLGVLHQMGAVLLLTAVSYTAYQMKQRST
ncbi:MAG TPA: COX15/CtaA family protein [Saprospiraceae bacterium]|nr:COX15/CtaA family protein [Saprospiraceae bacterium]